MSDADARQAVRDVLGYLNFSGGAADIALQRNVNRLHARFGDGPAWTRLRRAFETELAALAADTPAFADSRQAAAVLTLVFDHVVPAYRRHHADLLFHLSDEDFEQPLLLARIFEAVLSQGPPWDETDRVVRGALDALNNFLGYRPVAVLENDRQMEPYPHERFCPVPLFVQSGGESVVAAGTYHDLIALTIELLRETPDDLLHAAYFDLARMDELAVDVRAHDHLHPVNKRTNYMFGEWDPHRIDVSG
ncbi:MAG: hypothetical protein ACREJB_12545, partial [Planctomycetaceae bacterium]